MGQKSSGEIQIEQGFWSPLPEDQSWLKRDQEIRGKHKIPVN
jgi:hypothetical protein